MRGGGVGLGGAGVTGEVLAAAGVLAVAMATGTEGAAGEASAAGVAAEMGTAKGVTGSATGVGAGVGRGGGGLGVTGTALGAGGGGVTSGCEGAGGEGAIHSARTSAGITTSCGVRLCNPACSSHSRPACAATTVATTMKWRRVREGMRAMTCMLRVSAPTSRGR